MSSSPPRVLLFSQRQFDRMVYQCWKYEFEDVICEVDSVDLVAPPRKAESRLGSLRRRAFDKSRVSVGLLPEVVTEEVEVTREYDLFFAAFSFPAEAGSLRNLKGWRERSRQAACFLNEVWTKDTKVLKAYAPILRQFDHVFLHVGASLPLVASILGRPCHLIHVATDTLRFCPFPDPPARVVDCYSFGRRISPIHQGLLQIAARKPFFYLYDTVNNFAVINSSEHRRLLAETAKRSRYLIAYKHNLNATNQTGGDEALGGRLFEGAASGAILLGMAPTCPEFETCFGWTDAVVELPVAANDVESFLLDLDAQGERIREARRNNVTASLRSHDWVHRWSAILETVGMKPLAALDARKRRLTDLARLVWDAPDSSPKPLL